MQDYSCSLFCSYYKADKYIDGYIKNMLDQPLFEYIEFIFLDCDSPEEEYKKLSPIIARHDNVKYHRLSKDPGLYAGWNKAVKLCSSDIIGNWNVDDRKNKDGLGVLLAEFDKNPDLDVTYGFTYISRIANEEYTNNSFEEIYPYLPHTFSNLIRNNSPHCMPLWKKTLHDTIGYFDESYKTAADGDFWLRCAAAGRNIKLVNHPVGLYYENPTGRSTNPETLQEMIAEVNRMRLKYTGYINNGN